MSQNELIRKIEELKTLEQLIKEAEEEAEACLAQLKQSVPNAAIIGYVTEKEDSYIILE